MDNVKDIIKDKSDLQFRQDMQNKLELDGTKIGFWIVLVTEQKLDRSVYNKINNVYFRVHGRRQ